VRQPNDVGLHTYAENPHDHPRHTLELMGGTGLQVATGRATRMEGFGTDGPLVFGHVVTVDDRAPVPDGIALVTVTRDRRRPEEFHTVEAPVRKGRFEVVMRSRDWKLARAEYLPPVGFGPCKVDWAPRR
jgi:hypothetical protein